MAGIQGRQPQPDSYRRIRLRARELGCPLRPEFCLPGLGHRGTNRNVVGTSFDPSTAKVGNEELLNWLLHLLDPQVHCQFRVAEADGRRVVVLEIESAKHAPVRFKNEAFIRVGTYKKRLRDHVEIERRLWKTFDQSPFEAGIAREGMSDSATLAAIDYSSYFDLLRLPAPDGNAGILAALEADRLVRRSTGGTWDITNLGAVLFAKQIADFPTVARKAVRVVQYPGTSRVESLRELPGRRGYASGFENLNLAIAGALSTHEIVEQGVRRNAPTYPELALRELIANAFVHQDFTISGAGPMIEIFEDRIEIRQAAGQHRALPRQPAEITQRGAGGSPSSHGHLRRARQRLGSGGVADRSSAPSGATGRGAWREHTSRDVRSPTSDENGSAGSRTRSLPPRVPPLREPRIFDQLFAPHEIRN